jgi:hypothetical protein
VAKHAKDCCLKYLRKGKACKDCPILSLLGKKERKRRIEELRAAAPAKKQKAKKTLPWPDEE